ncbi:nitrogen regulation protein NR(II) [Halofilum ochraceum]|uniref:nitrogen regulation protein NR(II) n=1 Tax=Halofilum ochraceum TaxID=1611323 RepID=UPI0008D97B6D|nr:nitrogen regulation protein NR(II) [Halofilum ochraceum]
MIPDTDNNAGTAAAELLEALSGAILVVEGAELHVRYLNTAAEDLIRLSRRRALGQPLAVVAGFEPTWLDHVAANLDADATFTAREVTLTTHDATSTRQVDASVTPLAWGELASAVVIELTPVDRHLRIAREEGLRTQELANRRLLRGVAHEIRNPLAGLRGAAQLLARELEDDAQREYTDVIVREADRLRGLVDRMVGPVQPPAFERVNIHRLTEHVLQLLRGEAGEGVSLQTEYDPSIPDLQADGDQLIQALLNLGRNAIQAVGEQGHVTLRTSTRRRFTIGQVQHRLVACIEIADDGPGIPPDLLDSLFQPMVSGRAEGTGLGLTIAQSLVSRHGGLIECERLATADASGTGRAEPRTIFRVLLPLETGDD